MDDTRILPGTDWRTEISDALLSAKVAILLISGDFLASDFIVNDELPPLLESASNGGTTILCVLVGPSRFQRTPELARFQAVNSPSKPLSMLPLAEREAVWVKVADAVEAVFEGRESEEGWIVRNERILFDNLRSLVHEGDDGGFLVAEASGYYVQFMLHREGDWTELYSESVSNTYLPPSLQLTKASVDSLIQLGFAEPSDEYSNYRRSYRIVGTDEELRDIANTAVRVLADVYEVNERTSLDVEVALEG